MARVVETPPPSCLNSGSKLYMFRILWRRQDLQTVPFDPIRQVTRYPRIRRDPTLMTFLGPGTIYIYFFFNKDWKVGQIPSLLSVCLGLLCTIECRTD